MGNESWAILIRNYNVIDIATFFPLYLDLCMYVHVFVVHRLGSEVSFHSRVKYPSEPYNNTTIMKGF